MIYQLKITLADVKPPIWRRILVESGRTFSELHRIIQMVMGWEDSHLYEFRFKRTVVSPPDDELDAFPGLLGDIETISDDEATLSELFDSEKKCVYTYDFGDEWRHTIQLEKMLEAEPDKQYPLCTGGAGTCPPEDCGGAWGYMSLLNILSDRNHPEYEERHEWLLGGDPDDKWDADCFDIDDVNEELDILRMEDKLNADSQPPDLQQWRRLYELAGKIKATKPWEELSDADYIAVRPFGYSEPVYYSTMGMLGECVAVAAYPGARALARLEHMRENSSSSAPYAVLGIQECAVCYFGDREELDKEDREILRELGIKFRGRGEWIFFRSMKPGFAPWRINAVEAGFLCDTMEQYLDAYEDYAAGKCDVDFEAGEFLLRECSAPPLAEVWVNRKAALLRPRYVGEHVEITDELYIARLKKNKKSMLSVELDTIYLPLPVQNHKSQRPYFPRFILLAERRDGAIVGQQVVSPYDDLAGETFDVLRTMIESHGRPRSLTVRDDETAAIVADFCKKLDIRLEINPAMTVMDDAIESLMSFLENSVIED